MDFLAVLWEKLNLCASTHLVTSERQPRFTLSLESNSFYYLDYYEECNSTSLSNLAQCSPPTDPALPAAFVPLDLLASPQDPSRDLNEIQNRNVFLMGPQPPPPPNLAPRNPSSEVLLAYQSSSQEYLSESVRPSLHWNCRAKIVTTPAITTPSAISKVPYEATQVPQPAVFNSSHSPVQRYSSPPYCPQYESYGLPLSVPQVPSVPSDTGYGYGVSPSQVTEFEHIEYSQSCQQEKSVSELVDYLLSDDDCQAYVFEKDLGLESAVFTNFEDIDTSFMDDLMTAEPQVYQMQEQFVAYPSSSPSAMSAGSQSPVSQFVPIAPKPAVYPQSQSQMSASESSESGSRKRRTHHFSSPQEEYLVKRQLNNEASAKSRAKKRAKIEAAKVECVELETRNRELKDTVAELERQVATLKDILYSKIKK